MRPMQSLSILVGAVPILAVGAGVAAFLLMRAGYGVLVWGLLPFVGLLVISGALGLALGRAAGGRSGNGDSGRNGRSRDEDGV